MGDKKDKVFNAALEAQSVIRQHSKLLDMAAMGRSPGIDAIRALEQNSSVQRMLKELDYHREIMRVTAGPLEELRRAGMFDQATLFPRELETTRIAMAEFRSRFSLPEMSVVARLAEQFQASPMAEVLKRYEEQTSSFRKAMERMQTPWLDIQESMRSISGFAAVQGIGSALEHMPAFSSNLGVALRVDLGDWRDTITWPEAIFTDFKARADFYVGLGFDTALTDFPTEAFEASLDIAELRREPPQLIDIYGSPIPASVDDAEEEGLARTNKAHNWLMRLETQVRRFIDQQMTATFGPDWPKTRLPNGIYDQWQEKKRKALQSGGRDWPLVTYADFTDYILVICKRDNWPVFAPFFGRQEDVREAFQRLHPIRLDTMHARPVTQDDELLLFVETKRLVKVMIAKKPD